MRTKRAENRIRLIAWVICLISVFSCLSPIKAYASDGICYYPSAGQTIRVGWFKSPSFQEGIGDDEEKSGYSYDYLRKVAEYTEWKYEYVYGDWASLLDMLEKGEIDMLAGVATSDERKKKLLFPAYTMGVDKYYLYQHAENKLMNSADLSSFNKRKIGGLRNSRMTTYTELWAKKNHISPEIIYFDSLEQRDEAFSAHEVDAICATDTNVQKDQGYSTILKLGEEPFYLAVTKSRPDVLASLNSALRTIDQTEPYFLQSAQYQNYGTTLETSSLNEAEMLWIKAHPDIRIGYIEDYMPFCKKGSDGNATGVIVDLFNNLFSVMGIENIVNVTYVPYDSFQNMAIALRDGEINLSFPSMGERRYLDNMRINGTSEILSVPFYVAYMGNYSEKTFDVIALNNQPIQKITDEYPNSQILHVDSAEDCLEAVSNGRATCTIMASYRLKELMNDSKYRKIKTMPFGSSFSYCIGVTKKDKMLYTIMNKGIILVDNAVITDHIFKYIQADARYTIRDFMEDNFYEVLALGLLLFMVAALIMLSYVSGIQKARTETEKALLSAQRANAAKSDFLSRMSHDIRTPLNGIIGLLEISEKHRDDIELLALNRKKEKIAANHLLSLVNDILDMSKFEDDSFELPCESFDLYTVCEEVITICVIRARENGISSFTDDGVNLVYRNVYGSPLHLRQIWMNLINNGIKYNKPGGSISCTSSVRSCDGDTVIYDFTISDTGIGISESYLQHIYEPFTQERSDARSRYQGTGMGMAIVKALVDKMNGTISVQSEVGVGTTFVVSLPFKIDKTPSYAKADSDKEEISVAGMRILIAEDNDLNLEIAETILSDEGAIITTATNGKEALRLFLEKDVGTFDLILMDIMMPEVDGYEATRRIRGCNKADAASIPIVAMTANAFMEDIQEAKKAGMNDHLAKPLQMDKLLATIAKYKK